MAIAPAGSAAGEIAPDVIVIITLGSASTRHLELISDRAAHNFPASRVLVLGTDSQAGSSRPADWPDRTSRVRNVGNVVEMLANIELKAESASPREALPPRDAVVGACPTS
jgi:hypothetical protein